METTTKKKREIWPIAIVTSFILFAGLIFGSMYFMIKQDVDLVTEDYYAQEVAFQDHINKEQNTHRDGKAPEFEVDRELGLMTIGFILDPSLDVDPEGKIHFFRPSDADLDQELAVNVDESGRMLIPLNMLHKGYWRIRIEWQEGEVEYFHEEEIVV